MAYRLTANHQIGLQKPGIEYTPGTQLNSLNRLCFCSCFCSCIYGIFSNQGIQYFKFNRHFPTVSHGIYYYHLSHCYETD